MFARDVLLLLIEPVLASCNCLRSFSSFIACFGPGVWLWSLNQPVLNKGADPGIIAKGQGWSRFWPWYFYSTKKSWPFNQASLLWKRFFSSKASRSFIRHRPLQGENLQVWYNCLGSVKLPRKAPIQSPCNYIYVYIYIIISIMYNHKDMLIQKIMINLWCILFISCLFSPAATWTISMWQPHPLASRTFIRHRGLCLTNAPRGALPGDLGTGFPKTLHEQFARNAEVHCNWSSLSMSKSSLFKGSSGLAIFARLNLLMQSL